MATFVFTPVIAYLIYLYKWKRIDRLWLIPIVFVAWVNLHGGYIGARYRLLVGWLRPYVALGMPLFLYDEMEANGMGTSKRVALGVRGAGGVELKINGHFSVHADLGYERFFAVEESLFYTNYFIPTVGVIGRL